MNKQRIKAVLISLVIFSAYRSPLAFGSDVKAKLNSADGSTSFEVRDSAGVVVGRVDSDGNLIIIGTASFQGGAGGDSLVIRDGGDLKIYRTGNTGSAVLYCDTDNQLGAGNLVLTGTAAITGGSGLTYSLTTSSGINVSAGLLGASASTATFGGITVSSSVVFRAGTSQRISGSVNPGAIIISTSAFISGDLQVGGTFRSEYSGITLFPIGRAPVGSWVAVSNGTNGDDCTGDYLGQMSIDPRWFHPDGQIQVNLVVMGERTVGGVGEDIAYDLCEQGVGAAIDTVLIYNNPHMAEGGWTSFTATAITRMNLYARETNANAVGATAHTYVLVRPRLR